MIRPFGKQILVKLNAQKPGEGIVVPDKVLDKKQILNIELEVVACGEEVKLPIKSGDRIVCALMNVVFMDGWMGVEKHHGMLAEEKVLGVIM